MIFVDYLGSAAQLPRVREVVSREVAAAMRMPTTQVVVRRVRVDDESADIELWIELSTDEQLYRFGRQIAERISAGLRADDPDSANVWVMYRVVPLSHAFLNGQPRGRGTASID